MTTQGSTGRTDGLRQNARHLLRALLGALRDLLPILVVILLFQTLILDRPLVEPGRVAFGVVMLVLGLALLVRGLEMALFPLGESLANAFARKGNLAWLLLFAFGLGFGGAVAEPALIAVAGEATNAVVQSELLATADARAFAIAFRVSVATALGLALVLGMLRILRGWPVHHLLFPGYLVVVLLASAAPEIAGIAFDAGGAAISTVNVPLVTALGLGLAASLRGRNPFIDGFGLIAFCALLPMAAVLVLGWTLPWIA